MFCERSYELGRKIVKERDIPLRLGSNLQLKNTAYSTMTGEEEREQRRVKPGDERRSPTVSNR
jgi:hypothetical protein